MPCAPASPPSRRHPAWDADLTRYPTELAAAVGPASWQLATSAFLLTVAAILSLPEDIRREFAVAAAALTALAVPASFGLGWAAAPWPMVLTAVGIGVVGLSAPTTRAAHAHAIGAAAVGLLGAGAGLARPALTTAVLLVLFLAGVLVAVAPRLRIAPAPADVVSAWAAGGAAFALPGAVASFVATTVSATAPTTPSALRETTVPVLAAAFLAVCVTLGYAAIVQVSQRHIPAPLAVGTGLGALVVSAAAFGAPGSTVADAWVGALLLVAAVLLFLAPSIDAGRRADLTLDGSDLAAAAVTAALIATLVRIAAVLAPGGQLAVAAGLVLVVAVGARAMPEEWRRGPILGLAVGGLLIGLVAGWIALRGGVGVLATPARSGRATSPAGPPPPPGDRPGRRRSRWSCSRSRPPSCCPRRGGTTCPAPPSCSPPSARPPRSRCPGGRRFSSGRWWPPCSAWPRWRRSSRGPGCPGPRWPASWPCTPRARDSSGRGPRRWRSAASR